LCARNALLRAPLEAPRYDNYAVIVPNDDPVTSTRPLSALPSIRARIIAFVGICVAGLAGASIGFSMVDVQCSGSCAVPNGIGMFIGALIGAAGMSVVAVLVLRALGEWRELSDREQQ
jgi:hypothetical protein